MSNCLRWAQGIKAQGSVSIATGESRTAPIDPADIAAVARLALTRPGHEGKTYELTGVDVLSGREQVETLAKALGRPIQVVDVSVEQAVEGMRRGGRMPPKLLEAQGEMLEAIRSGRLARKTTDTVRELTGSAAGSFAAWCERHKGAFL